MLGNETKALKRILKQLERNKQRLEKQALQVEEIIYNLDKKTLDLMLTLKQ